MSHLLRSPSSSSSFHRNGKLHKQCVSLLALNVNSCLYSFSFLFSGNFEPPGARAVASFVNEYDRETDPRWLAVKEAGRRAERAEKAAERAEKAMAGGHAPIVPAKPKGPKCSICRRHVDTTVNPWQQTRGDLLSLDIDDSDAESDTDAGHRAAETSAAGAAARKELRRSKLKKRGIQLKPCQHVFCGACLAKSIYRKLDVAFDPLSYGTKIAPTQEAPRGGKLEFPMGCPTCQVKPGEKMVEIGDMTARLVLGDCNMDEWNQARFMSTLDIIYCPRKGCHEPFDANDVAPAPSGTDHVEELVQCPRCRQSLCKACKVVWHDKLTCQEYQALPAHERAPEDLALMELAKKEKWRRCPKVCSQVAPFRSVKLTLSLALVV